MSLDRIYKVLIDLGLSETDSRVYLYIAINGPLKVKTIIEELKINKQQLYPILKKLCNKNIIAQTNTRPSIVTAISFEIVLELLINSKIEKSKRIQEKKKELLSNWKAVYWNTEK